MESLEEKYKNEAINLWHKDEYWRVWGSWQAIAAYLRDRGCCVYCGRDLFRDSETLFGMQTLEHLLPQSKYPKLEKDFWNLAAACNYCNNLKRSWDPNGLDEGAQIYGDPDRAQPLTEDQHGKLKQRAKEYISINRAKKQVLFETASVNFRDALSNISMLQMC